MLRTLTKQIKQYKKQTILTPLLTAAEVVTDVLIPFVIASLIDKGISQGNIQNVYLYGSVMLVMAFLSLFFGVSAGRCAAVASSGFAANLRSAMYKNIQTYSFANIDKFSSSGLVTRMTTDVTNLQNAFQSILRITVRAPLRLILSIVMCIVIDVRLSLIFIVALVVLSSLLYIIISKVSKIFTQVFAQYDNVNSVVQENISGIRVVKSFVREEHEKQKFDKVAKGLYNLYVRAEKLMAYNNPVMNMVVYGCIIALSWWGAHFIVEGSLTTGELTSLFTYVMSILMSLMMLSMIFVMLTMSSASGKRVAEVINMQTDICDPQNPLTDVKSGAIDFSHVYFAYPRGSGEYAISDLDFHIFGGQTIGVIGPTASGKSSLVNLISRLYDADKGTVSVGGIDVRNYNLKTLRDNVAVVLQKNVLFSGTIAENLRWGNQDATLDELKRVCGIAQASEFIDLLPDGYDTVLEQGGVNLSGGQKQRLCIARALLKKPKILILDDSTSACDNDTDKKIRQALKTEVKDMTTVIIAQRISSVKDCDMIIVLDSGRLVGFDKHENLIENNAIYQDICALQEEDGGDFDKKM
ncbi:MAG: ABC transporter ATP-binding protein [Bacteroidales bacterium]|nr:ABC transporter ATP-binding protein [Bacteroidales bacterium]